MAIMKVGSGHGSVIPVLAQNPNYPEEQSAVVMCGQSLKTNLSSPVPVLRSADWQTDKQQERPESFQCNDVSENQSSSVTEQR